MKRELTGGFEVAAGEGRFTELLDRVTEDIQELGGGQVFDVRLLGLVVAESHREDMAHPMQRMIAAKVRRAGNGVIADAGIEVMQRQPDGAVGNAQKRLLAGRLAEAGPHRLFVERQLPNLLQQEDLVIGLAGKGPQVVEAGGGLDGALVMAQNGFRQAGEQIERDAAEHQSVHVLPHVRGEGDKIVEGGPELVEKGRNGMEVLVGPGRSQHGARQERTRGG